MPAPRPLVLASTSRYRRELLGRLGIPFECADPRVEEFALPEESPLQTAQRLAEAKARAVAKRFPGAVVVGSDQVASCGGERLGKPGTHANAVRQLNALSGKIVQFDTAVSVIDGPNDGHASRVVPCKVTFRPLTAAQIENYLRAEQPYDCTASAKAEGLGIALIARIETDDPTSLIGLPLIALTEMLGGVGISVLGA